MDVTFQFLSVVRNYNHITEYVRYKFFPQASEDAKESSLLEQTLEPDNTLLSVFPHETQDERYITKLWKIMFLHGTKLAMQRALIY